MVSTAAAVHRDARVPVAASGAGVAGAGWRSTAQRSGRTARQAGRRAPSPTPGGRAPLAQPHPAARPASDATIRITSPRDEQTVHGPTVHVVVQLNGARIVKATTTDIRPDEGHVHLYVDNSLVSMNYGLEQDLTWPGHLVPEGRVRRGRPRAVLAAGRLAGRAGHRQVSRPGSGSTALASPVAPSPTSGWVSWCSSLAACCWSGSLRAGARCT